MKKYWIGILLLASMPAWAMQPYDKLPYPEAAAKTMPAEMAGTEVKPEVNPEAAPPSGETADQTVDDIKRAAPTGPAPQIESPKIGSPNNPYCRFCTD